MATAIGVIETAVQVHRLMNARYPFAMFQVSSGIVNHLGVMLLRIACHHVWLLLPRGTNIPPSRLAFSASPFSRYSSAALLRYQARS